jgi:simple sugar transport system substrate-binding protein
MEQRARQRVWRSVALVAAVALALSGCNNKKTDETTASAGQFCKGTKIVFFPGGAPGGGFETVVYNGAKAAEAAFGPSVQYQWSDWDPQKMVTQFQEAVATHPDGIAIMGHPGDSSFDPLIADARDQGILVTSMNTELPKAFETYVSQGFGYAGAVLYNAGADLAKEAIKRGGLKQGDRVFVWGLLSQPGRGERTKGIVDTLKQAGMTVDYLEIDDATNADPANGVSPFTGYVSKHKDVKAMFFDHGNLTSSAPTYMKSANLAPGSIYVAGFDMSPATVQGIKDGYISLVIDQQEWLQGFFGVLQLCLTKQYGFSGLMINTGGGFDDKSNINELEPLVKKQIR